MEDFSFPWEREITADKRELELFVSLTRLDKAGKLKDLEAVKEIKQRDGYIKIKEYFDILENWDYYKEQVDLYNEQKHARWRWVQQRMGEKTFWSVKIARFISENNKSDNPEEDLFCCLRDPDVMLYIEWILSDDIYDKIINIPCPINVSDITFLDPKFRVTRSNIKELFPEIEKYYDIWSTRARPGAKRLKDTMSLLLTPGMMKKDKIAILNYLVNKETNGITNQYLGKWPKQYTFRVWKSLFTKQNLLLLTKENILKIYNKFKEVQPINNGLGSVVKKVTGIRLSKPYTDKFGRTYFRQTTNSERKSLELWTKKLEKQKKEKV